MRSTQRNEVRVEPFSSALYNGLLGVEQVEQLLNSTMFFANEFEVLASIFKDYRVEASVGICLLHNHNRIADSEVMVQSREMNKRYGDSLVTIPRGRNGRRFKQASPWSFAVAPETTDASLIPVEFSDDQLVREDYFRLLEEEAFVREFCRYTVHHNLNALIGLALVRRSFPAAKDGIILVEATEGDKRKSIVYHARETDYAGVKLVQTIYPTGDVHNRAGTTACVVVCSVRSYCIARSPGHARESSHGRVHGVGPV
jgi:hypothetical protein